MYTVLFYKNLFPVALILTIFMAIVAFGGMSCTQSKNNSQMSMTSISSSNNHEIIDSSLMQDKLTSDSSVNIYFNRTYNSDFNNYRLNSIINVYDQHQHDVMSYTDDDNDGPGGPGSNIISVDEPVVDSSKMNLDINNLSLEEKSKFLDAIIYANADLEDINKEEQVALIQAMANDYSEDVQSRILKISAQATEPLLRVAAISAVNWDNKPSELSRMIEEESDPMAQVAVLAAINSAAINQYERAKLDQRILDGLLVEPDSDVINRALSYFYGQDSELMLKALDILNSRDLQPDVEDHIIDLAKGAPYIFDAFFKRRISN